MERRRRRRGRGQGPRLHLKLSNEIYNKKNEAFCSKDQIKFLIRHSPPPFLLSVQRDRLKRVGLWVM